MLAAHLRKPIIKRPIIIKPIIRRPIVTKPRFRVVKVPVFVPKLVGVGGLGGFAKAVTNMLNPLAPSRLYPAMRSSSSPTGRNRPKIEKSADDSRTSNENSSGMNFYVYNMKH